MCVYVCVHAYLRVSVYTLHTTTHMCRCMFAGNVLPTTSQSTF